MPESQDYNAMTLPFPQNGVHPMEGFKSARSTTADEISASCKAALKMLVCPQSSELMTAHRSGLKKNSRD